MINPIWLNTFKTLIDIGHFTKTAHALHMTQPGVTQHINKLEEACGFALIKRHNKRFELTEQGKKVYQYALQCKTQERDLLQSLGHDEPFAGVCRISGAGSLMWALYEPLLELQANHPKLSIQLEATPNQSIFEKIRRDEIDLGLVTHKPNADEFDSEIIAHEPLVIVVPKNTDTERPINDILQSLGMVKHPDLMHFFQSYRSHPKFSQVNIKAIETRTFINQVHQILVPIAKGIGFTVIPKACVDLFAHRDKVKILTTGKTIKEPIYLVKKRHLDLGKRYDAVIEVIREVLN